jgi:hypothetical protein
MQHTCGDGSTQLGSRALVFSATPQNERHGKADDTGMPEVVAEIIV